MMKALQYIFLATSLLATLFSCNLEREVDLDLPVYENQPVVECYLEPGKPFRLLLTRSASFFAPFDTNLVNFVDNILEREAVVIIRHNGQIYPLSEGQFFDLANQKIYNYGSSELVPENFNQDFELEITLKDGSQIGAITRILPLVPIDSIKVQFNEDEPKDTLARVLTFLSDPDPVSENRFRRQLHWNSLTDSIAEQDFIATDQFSDNGTIAFGTGFDFPVGDSVYNTIFHITQEHFDFLESVFNAASSNGNPFGQPSTIASNVKGSANPLGIFTGISYTRIKTIISR